MRNVDDDDDPAPSVTNREARDPILPHPRIRDIFLNSRNSNGDGIFPLSRKTTHSPSRFVITHVSKISHFP